MVWFRRIKFQYVLLISGQPPQQQQQPPQQQQQQQHQQQQQDLQQQQQPDLSQLNPHEQQHIQQVGRAVLSCKWYGCCCCNHMHRKDKLPI